jgi:hypothetical protein
MPNKKLICIGLLLLVIPLAFAIELDDIPQECEETEFMKPATWMSCGLAKTYQSFFDFLLVPMEQLTEVFGELMILDIHFSSLGPYRARFNYLAMAFVVVLIVYAGYLWLFAAIDTEKRRIAKKQTLDLVYIIFFINISLLLGWLLLQTANGAAAYLWRALLND